MTLQRGSRGEDVRIVQNALAKLGYAPGAPDGDFGPGTEAALVKWEQERYADGTVSDDELAYFRNVAAETSTLPKPPNGYVELIRLFGEPYKDGTPDGGKWWAANQAAVKVADAFTFNLRDRIYVNKYIAAVTEATFSEIAARGLAPKIKTFDGCFKVRAIRGYENAVPPRYSIHTWGMAIDLNAATNGLGVRGDIDPGIVSVFKSFGWIWGGDFKRLDPMHFQYATGC